MGSTIVSSLALDEIQFKRIYVLQFFTFAEDLHPSSGVEFVPFLLRITECNGIKIISLCIRKKSAIQLYSIRGLNPFRGWHKINCKICQKTPMHGGQEYFYFMFIRPNNTEDVCQKA